MLIKLLAVVGFGALVFIALCIILKIVEKIMDYKDKNIANNEMLKTCFRAAEIIIQREHNGDFKKNN